MSRSPATPRLANIVMNNGQPLETWATNYVPTFNLLPSGTYYWNVVPVDSEGNRGHAVAGLAPSTGRGRRRRPPVRDRSGGRRPSSSTRSSRGTPSRARRSTRSRSTRRVDFAPGSKVCCTQLTTSTSLAPTVVFRDNTYYWRVRALDAAGNAGVWNLRPRLRQDLRQGAAGDARRASRTCTCATTSPIRAPTSTSAPPATRRTSRSSSGTPFLARRAYLVDVAPFDASVCDWGGIDGWRVTTSVPSWTPLGSGWNNVKPYPGRDARRHRLPVLDAQRPLLRPGPGQG